MITSSTGRLNLSPAGCLVQGDCSSVSTDDLPDMKADNHLQIAISSQEEYSSETHQGVRARGVCGRVRGWSRYLSQVGPTNAREDTRSCELDH